jgi:hypothetical protein
MTGWPRFGSTVALVRAGWCLYKTQSTIEVQCTTELRTSSSTISNLNIAHHKSSDTSRSAKHCLSTSKLLRRSGGLASRLGLSDLSRLLHPFLEHPIGKRRSLFSRHFGSILGRWLPDALPTFHPRERRCQARIEVRRAPEHFAHPLQRAHTRVRQCARASCTHLACTTLPTFRECFATLLAWV